MDGEAEIDEKFKKVSEALGLFEKKNLTIADYCDSIDYRDSPEAKE